VVHVHDLVDYVTVESQLAGKGAAAYIASLEKQEVLDEAVIATQPGHGISYIVPQHIQLCDQKESVKLYMRVNQTFSGAKLVIRQGERIIKELKRRHMAPGEMESIMLEVDPALLGREALTVAVVESSLITEVA
jgi:hypothetical protein